MRGKCSVLLICVMYAFSLLFSSCVPNTPSENHSNVAIQWSDEQGVCYQKNEQEEVCYVVGVLDNYAEEIVIPSTFQELPVTKIKEFAFYEKSGLKSVSILDGILAVEKSAFSNCESLVEVELPQTIEQIGYHAFDGCNQLKYEKKEGLHYLGNEANPFLYLVKAENNHSRSVVEQGCKLIAPYAFMDCKELEEVEIPFGVISIGRQCFDGCDKLKEVSLPRSIKFLDSFVFAKCSKLVELSFDGTSQEWELLEKIWDWRYECVLKKIRCLDKIVYIN